MATVKEPELLGSHPGGGASRVKQSESGAADINQMVARFIRTGAPPPSVGKEPTYGDFTSFTTFHDAVNRVRQADADFGALDPIVRRACDHDPGKFLDMVHDPERREELLALGLVQARVPKTAGSPDAAAPEGGKTAETSEADKMSAQDVPT